MAPLVWSMSASSSVVRGGVHLRGSGQCRQGLPLHAIGRASVKRAKRPELIIEASRDVKWAPHDPLFEIIRGQPLPPSEML